MRKFEGGATRDSDDFKFDYEGFTHPLVEHSFAAYMHAHRKQADGAMRDSDNWQQGFGEPEENALICLKSLKRHVQDLHLMLRGVSVVDERGEPITMEDCYNSIRFNAQAGLYGFIRDRKEVRRG